MKGIDHETPEKDLIEAAQKDPGLFSELYEQNFERVYAFIATRVKNRDQAQDLTADVFHQALANLAKFEWRGVPFAAWLYRIASNAIVDHSRKTAREVFSADYDSTIDPDIEQKAILFRLVNDLPADQRSVISLRFTEQKSIREIATELGRTEGAIKQLQLRALQNLRKRMSDSNG